MPESPLLDGRYALPAQPQAEGGYAQLFRAFDFRDRCDVAIKMFKTDDAADPELLRRVFTQELEAYNSLPVHPNLTALKDFGYLEDRTPYIVVEWCDGGDLSQFFDEAPSWEALQPVILDVLSGLEQLHANNYVHRDVKPQNVLVHDGRFKLGDFGTTRIRQVTDIGRTLAQLGTPPYSPPELGDFQPTPAYDVFSTAVLAIELLTGQNFENRAEVLAASEKLSCPDDIASLLRRSISKEATDRPQSAGALRALLLEASPATQADEHPRLAVDVSPNALAQYRAVFSNPNLTAADLLSDLQSPCVFKQDAEGVVRAAGQTVIAAMVVHSRYPWVFAVTGVSRPPQRLLDAAQATWIRRPSTWVESTTTPDQAAAVAVLEEFVLRLSEDEASVAGAASSEPALARAWRRVLDAKRDIASRSGSQISYRSFRAQGSRVAFAVDSSEVPPPGERRVVKVGTRWVLRGEVETVLSGEIVLFVTDGSAENLPKSGRLEFDAELTRSKLARERRALERVFVGGAQRSDLRTVLTRPETNAIPLPELPEVEFIQGHLDPAKRAAVVQSLVSPDMFVVQGPPGTGKTTYISEVVAQVLRASDSKILLASQTHTALDHALEKVQTLLPTARFLRIGSGGRSPEASEPWSIAAQMASWKEDAAAASSEYVGRVAKSLGVDEETLSTRELATSLQRDLDLLVATGQELAALKQEESELAERARVVDVEVRRLLDMLARLDPAASSLPALTELVDRGLDLATQLDNAGLGGEELLQVQSRIEQTDRELISIQESAAVTRGALMHSVPSGESKDDATLIAAATELEDTAAKRISKLRALREDWLDRFGKSRDFEAILIWRAQVVASTCVGLMGVRGAEAIPFDLCIVDEASKANPTELLVPLASSKRWILVGDHRQLPPFLENELADSETLDRFGITDDDVRLNLFQMLAEHLPKESVTALTSQHRMVPAIGDLVSEVFYEGQLKSAQRESDPAIKLALGAEVVWLDTKARAKNWESAVGTSFRNSAEARAIVRVLQRLDWAVQSQGPGKLGVAVLAGYSAQVKEIQNVLSSTADLARLEVDVATIDSYQGQEADVCIVSLTRSNRRLDPGFSSNAARLNVALSRARDGLVIVGNSEMATEAKRPGSLGEVFSYVSRDPRSKVQPDE
jgi:hypothetical protein